MEEEEISTFEYQAFKVNHRTEPGAPSIYLLNADAYEITQWADVPRKGQDYMEGYQRQLSESRVNDIKEYFELDENNIIPGAILVAIDEDEINIEEGDDGVYSISIKDKSEGTVEELIERKYEQLYSRLGDEEKRFVAEEDGGKAETQSYLARLAKELRRANEDFSRFSGDDQDALESLVRSTTRPGLILDGQHRVHGASKVAEDIHLPIVLLPGLDKDEQVFHFYIVNNKAEPLTKEQLLVTLATSLTDGEVEHLFERLEKAGVDAEEARLAYRADTSPNSPFAGLVDYEGAVGQQTGVFRYKVLHRVIDEFVNMSGDYKVLYKDIDDWQDDEQYEYRMDRFYTLWNAIKRHYPELWSDAMKDTLGQEEFEDQEPEQFFYGVTMRVLQKYVLEHMTHLNNIYVDKMDIGPILDNNDAIHDTVEDALEGIDEQFFRREWEVSSLDTSDGRDFFKSQLDSANGLEPRHMHTLGMFRGR